MDYQKATQTLRACKALIIDPNGQPATREQVEQLTSEGQQELRKIGDLLLQCEPGELEALAKAAQVSQTELLIIVNHYGLMAALELTGELQKKAKNKGRKKLK